MADQPNYEKPVAYDAEGRPLYAHPPTEPTQTEPQTTPQIVQMTRASDPIPLEPSDNAKARHEESAAKYPQLNLSSGEYIINEVRRHPIGLVPIAFVTIFMVLIVLGGLMAYPAFRKTSGASLPPVDGLVLPAIMLVVLILLGGYIAFWIYTSNRFYLTNESVIQEIQTGLFARNEQTVSLLNIEDASYRQLGLMQSLFNYGSIRLSTEGDETTYRFNYVSNPKEQIATLNNAVEAYKNGRPVVND